MRFFKLWSKECLKQEYTCRHAFEISACIKYSRILPSDITRIRLSENFGKIQYFFCHQALKSLVCFLLLKFFLSWLFISTGTSEHKEAFSPFLALSHMKCFHGATKFPIWNAKTLQVYFPPHIPPSFHSPALGKNRFLKANKYWHSSIPHHPLSIAIFLKQIILPVHIL